ncbi:hypothetical protein PIB30_026320 [Stylosanthes scabra]|uniref:Uncharacterized protein n=1 Tax=Stylosanthes scabra TaxID=79078 RepID=A0ABU6XB86_9FABA|nr:hypothetical protein [Stylosanthes scabra]
MGSSTLSPAAISGGYGDFRRFKGTPATVSSMNAGGARFRDGKHELGGGFLSTTPARSKMGKGRSAVVRTYSGGGGFLFLFLLASPAVSRRQRTMAATDTFYLDTVKTHLFYAFGHHHLSTDYSIVHVYGMTGEMKMCMYSSSSAQWSQEQGALSYINYFDRELGMRRVL